jgi:ribose transport system permease protein
LKQIKTFILNSNLTSALIPIIVIGVVLSLTTEGFFTAFNLFSIGKNGSIFVLVGLAQMAVMSLGQMNLALGAMGCCSAIVAAVLMQELGLPIGVCLLVGAITGIVLGGIQGILVTRTKISPFIITLSLSSIYYGLATGLTGGKIFNDIPKTFRQINAVGIAGIPLLLVLAIVIGALCYVLYAKMSLGRKLLATGANARSAECAGIKTKNTILFGHALSGLISAIAGMLTITLLGSAKISIGTDWMLVSFAGPVLGSCVLSGGKVSAFGTLLGALLMQMITNALVLLNVSYFWFQTFVGLILLVAFEIDRARGRMLSRIR